MGKVDLLYPEFTDSLVSHPVIPSETLRIMFDQVSGHLVVQSSGHTSESQIHACFACYYISGTLHTGGI